MKLLILTLLLVSFRTPLGKNCACLAPEPNEITHRGGNELVSFIEKKTYRSVRGVVRDVNGAPLKGVLVEIFDKPGWIRNHQSSSPSDQQRIAACKTGPDGSFCFENVRAGEYELRGSLDLSWNPSHVLLKVNPNAKSSSRKAIALQMTVGT